MRFATAILIGALAISQLSAADPTFTEQTAGAGIDAAFASAGYAHWNYTGGGAVGDFDDDGWQDLFVLSGGVNNDPDYLYINNGDGTFTDQALAWGLTDVHLGKGAAVGDYNGDGRLDLYVTSAGPVGNDGPCHHRLYRNDGNTFTEVGAAAGVNCTSAAEDGFGASFGDYDLDGDLDLFVAGFAPNNSGSRLFRNNGNGTFTDITAAIGFFDTTPISMSAFTPRFVDMDGDDYPEMLLVADFGTSRYFRNNADGTFTDITGASNTSQEENGMGGTVGDFNGDLKLDWYVSSIYAPQILWTGNKLYLNQGNHFYTEVSDAAGVKDGGYGWACVGVDFNHDQQLDIAETNGETTPGSPFENEQSYLWRNDGDGTYTEMAIAAGIEHDLPGRGMVHFDYDNDGDQDLVIMANNDVVRLYRNELSGPDTHWFRVFLDTSQLPGLAPDGIGSRVIVSIGGKVRLRYIQSGDNFLSHSELSAHFGAAGATEVTGLRVEWADGSQTEIDTLAVNQTVTLMADGPVACAPAPAEIEGLQLQKLGGEIRFTWADAADADDYVVFGDSSFEGGFELVLGSGTSGVAGVGAAIPPGDKYFLVAGRRNDCLGEK